MRLRRMIAAALVAAAFAAPAAAAGAASATPVRGEQCWGSNKNVWTAYQAAVPAAHCVRVYYDTTDVFPATWPDEGGAWTMLSIRPSYAGLMSDPAEQAKIHGLCLSAPGHSRLTIDHENAGDNPLGYPPSIHDPGNYVRMQQEMVKLCAGTHTAFGVIIIAPYSSVLNWIYKGDQWFAWDFYAFDRYLNHGPMARAQGGSFVTAAGTINVKAVEARMMSNLRTLQKFTGLRYPPLALGETNASADSQRITWFTTLGNWLGQHDGGRMAWILTRWTDCPPGTPHCGLSGPWPPSAPVVARLKYLAEEYA